MKNFTFLISLLVLVSCSTKQSEKNLKSELSEIKTSITKTQLHDKIKGGWAGQVIGCTFGGPTEFRFKGTMINDYQPISWDENSCLWYFQNAPGLYDDVYMDLTFVDVFEKQGLDAPAKSHALAFANAGYKLWHANQAARYNILHGIMPPQSGHWLNNPHADDIDFQIEADFAGLMAPGMVNVATGICDKVGHIMNYGDGWYGGVFVASMYSLAFVSDDVAFVVNEALKAIPVESQFHQCIADVIGWHKKYPDDWKQTWYEIQKKWSSDIGCPDGVFTAFDIDSKLNSAYIVIGLLYGEGDYSKTLEIATRCGQDSDCNPASAGGILGTLLGYSNIPEFWKKPLAPVENINFKYTTMSLNDVYTIGTKHALQLLEKNGVNIENDIIGIPVQKIIPVKLEQGFVGLFPIERKRIGEKLNAENQSLEVEFTGNGFVLTGSAQNVAKNTDTQIVELQMRIDGGEPETIEMPVSFRSRRHDVAWKYQLPETNHIIKISLKNPKPGFSVQTGDLIVYSSNKIENIRKTN